MQGRDFGVGSTEFARRHRLSGTVIVHTVIDTSGRAASIMIVRPLDDGLDEAAVKAIRTWRFTPAKMNQEPVAVPVTIEVTFHM